MFRVQAINELGLSEESQESAPITVKAALSQFHSFAHSNSMTATVMTVLLMIFLKVVGSFWGHQI